MAPSKAKSIGSSSLGIHVFLNMLCLVLGLTSLKFAVLFWFRMVLSAAFSSWRATYWSRTFRVKRNTGWRTPISAFCGSNVVLNFSRRFSLKMSPHLESVRLQGTGSDPIAAFTTKWESWPWELTRIYPTIASEPWSNTWWFLIVN